MTEGIFQDSAIQALTLNLSIFVEDPDYNIYMDSQQAVYLEILNVFTQKGIEFAYPTQTLQIQGLENSFK